MIAKPLNKLTGSKVMWSFGDAERAAFKALKEACCARPTLANPDFKRPFLIDVDASDVGHGYMLYQLDEKGSPEPVMYGSKYWASNKEACRPVYYREGHALFAAVKACRFYIEASPFTTTVMTDHAPLRWVLHSRRGQVTPWSVEELQDLPIHVEYKPGVANSTVDAMSRYPVVPETGSVFRSCCMLVAFVRVAGPRTARLGGGLGVCGRRNKSCVPLRSAVAPAV